MIITERGDCVIIIFTQKNETLKRALFFAYGEKCKTTRNFREILESGKGFLNRLPWEQGGSFRQDLDALEPTAQNFREILGAGLSCRDVSGFCPKISGKFWERTSQNFREILGFQNFREILGTDQKRT